jgi:hypothetical protein
MTPARHNGDLKNYPVASFQNLIEIHSNKLISEKAKKYDIDDVDVLSMPERLEELSKPCYGLSNCSSDFDKSFYAEFDSFKAIHNTFKKKLQRRSSRLIGLLNRTE